MRNYWWVLFCLSLWMSCKKQQEKTVAFSAQQIVDKAIEKSGGNFIDGKEICFDFRGNEYISARKDWNYSLQRVVVDSFGATVHDILSNRGFTRYENDEAVILPDSLVSKYANSVNSVHYFAYLPYGLNDKAVQKELLNQTDINGTQYFVVKVTFSEVDGGDDFEDVFLYWIHSREFTVDYLAYEFHTNGGGLRFREAYNPRMVNGVRFVDYRNYKPLNKKATLYDLESLFKANKLDMVSNIELENIYVQSCPDC